MFNRLLFALLVFASTVACTSTRHNIQLIDSESFATTTDDGEKVELYTIRGGDLSMQVTSYGGRVVSLWTPDRNGNMEDIVVGFARGEEYVHNSHERFLGASVGPFANRIASGRFTLEGKEYCTPQNNNGQTLHGGELGIDRIVWQVAELRPSSILLACNLPDGQDGFPGNRHIEMRYTLTPDNVFMVDFSATTDATTIMNLAHHSFFSLRGEGRGDVLDYELQIRSSFTTPVDDRLIPTGEIRSVDGTPFDFRQTHTIGERINADDEQLSFGHGYDHNWIIDRTSDTATEICADVYDPESGRGITIASDQPAIQFYAGNFFDGSHCGKYGRPIGWRSAVVFETQRYPDSPNHANFTDCTLRPNETYTHHCEYRFYTK